MALDLFASVSPKAQTFSAVVLANISLRAEERKGQIIQGEPHFASLEQFLC